jgi:hypothetical protein
MSFGHLVFTKDTVAPHHWVSSLLVTLLIVSFGLGSFNERNLLQDVVLEIVLQVIEQRLHLSFSMLQPRLVSICVESEALVLMALVVAKRIAGIQFIDFLTKSAEHFAVSSLNHGYCKLVIQILPLSDHSPCNQYQISFGFCVPPPFPIEMMGFEQGLKGVGHVPRQELSHSDVCSIDPHPLQEFESVFFSEATGINEVVALWSLQYRIQGQQEVRWINLQILAAHP